MRTAKPFKGPAMEGRIARWYARNTEGDTRFRTIAEGVAATLAPGARILEVAPGPGYFAIDLAKRGFSVTGVDISRTFVEIAEENARKAAVEVDFQVGNASALPFADGAFDLVVCMAAFKNFSDPLNALDEAHRVLGPQGRALIYDLRKEASRSEINAEVDAMRLSRLNSFWTRQTFRWFLLKNAYTRESLLGLVRNSRFGTGLYREDGIGFELTLVKAAEVGSQQARGAGEGIPAASSPAR